MRDAAWAYSPVIELASLPEAVETGLARAGVALWKVAEAGAAAIMGRERLRMEEAIAAERELRQEALGMVDARDAVIEAQRGEIAWFVAELERQKDRVRTVKARDFRRRVIREILPEREALHVSDITLRIGADLVHEAGEHLQAWNVDKVRGAIDEPMYRNRYFVGVGGGRYRKRRPEEGGSRGEAPRAWVRHERAFPCRGGLDHQRHRRAVPAPGPSAAYGGARAPARAATHRPFPGCRPSAALRRHRAGVRGQM